METERAAASAAALQTLYQLYQGHLIHANIHRFIDGKGIVVKVRVSASIAAKIFFTLFPLFRLFHCERD